MVARMAVNATHPDYDASALDWSRARDVLSGEDAVKAAGEKYLPRLDTQTDDEFAASQAGACLGCGDGPGGPYDYAAGPSR